MLPTPGWDSPLRAASVVSAGFARCWWEISRGEVACFFQRNAEQLLKDAAVQSDGEVRLSEGCLVHRLEADVELLAPLGQGRRLT